MRVERKKLRLRLSPIELKNLSVDITSISTCIFIIREVEKFGILTHIVIYVNISVFSTLFQKITTINIPIAAMKTTCVGDPPI